MQIKKAQKSDAKAVAALWNDMISNTDWTFTTALKSEQAILDMMDGVGDVFVASDRGQIVGFSTYGQFRNGPGYAHSMEHSIVISKSFRGQKIGAKLLNAVEDDARHKGFHTMIGGVSSSNPRGEAFHAAMGYEFIGRFKEVGFKNGKWLDLILMQKML